MSSKIVMEFTTATGNKKITANYANPSATSNQVKTAMQSIVTNGSILKPVPTGIVSAYISTTTQEDFDLSD